MKGVRMLVNIFHPLPVGGAERQAERLATYLAFRNIPVGIITRRVGELPVYEKMSGFEVFRIREFGSPELDPWHSLWVRSLIRFCTLILSI